MLKKLITLCVLLPTIAVAASFVEGKDYQTISNPHTTKSNHKIPIIEEFFSYGCPWCYKIEKPLHEWMNSKIGKNVQFESIPVVFKPSWELYAKAYYTMKALALSNTVHPLLFKAIQKDKNTLDSTSAMITFFIAQGVDKEIATSAFEHSLTIETRVQNGMRLMQTYQINAIPAFVVNHKYKTDLHMAGTSERLLQILDFLQNR